MRVADICSHRVICVSPEASVQEAADLMRDHDVGALVVTHPGKRKPVGIITDRDIVMNIVAGGKNPRTVAVASTMTSSLATCRGSHEVFDVLELMRHRGIRRVPVVDARSALIGMLTTDDLLGALAEHLLALARSIVGDDTLERRHYRDEKVAEKTKRPRPRTRAKARRPL